MLSITIVTLLITSNVISRIQAEEQEERKAPFNGTQTPVYKSDSVIEALKVQKKNTRNIVPESYEEQTKSQSGNRLRRNTIYMLPNREFKFPVFNMKSHENSLKIFDAPSNKTGQFNYLGSRTFQRNNVYNAENDEKPVLYGSVDVQIGNTFFSDNSNVTNVYGPILVQENNTYQGKNKNAQYGASVTQIGNNYSKNPAKNDIYSGVVVQNDNTYSENPKNKTLHAISINQSNNNYPNSIENNKEALKPVIHQRGNFFPSSNDSEAGMNTKNNTEGQLDIAEQNATDSQGNSVSTNYDSRSHIENKTLYNKEKETYADKHTVPNKQMSLYNGFSARLFYFIVLFKLTIFDS